MPKGYNNHQRGRVPSNPQNNKTDNKPPYHFVYNDPARVLRSERVAHNSKESGLFSGEIKFSLTTLTQSIFGCYQEKKTITVEGKNREKAYLYPAFYQDQSMILGSSILGALRHNCAALTNAPMEHIGEQTFAYRPSIGNGSAFQTLPAIIISNPPFTLRIFKGQPKFIFVSERASKYFDPNTTLSEHNLTQQPTLLVKEKYLSFNNKVISSSIYLADEIAPNQIANLEAAGGQIRYRFFKYHDTNHFKHYTYHMYKGGIEYSGVLAQTKGHTNPRPYVGILLNVRRCEYSDIQISEELSNQYENTTEHLKNQVSGHISNRHPNVPSSLGSLPEDIHQHRCVEVGQVIFAEVKSTGGKLTLNDINSIGNNYNYYWAYQNSIHTVKGQLRPQIQQSFTPEALPLVQKLFGYANETCKSQDDKLAGLVSINHALEQITNKANSVKQKSITIPLKPLGQPKPSAGEFYLKPKTSNSANKIPHYGYSPNENPEYELNGRKFYLHQRPYSPPTVQEAASNKKNHLATTANFITPEGTEYRATLRFKNLNKSELGLLLLALSPNSLEYRQLPDNCKKDLNHILISTDTLAIKLGYARSLGFGSVQTKIHSITTQCKSDLTTAALINSFLSTQQSFNHIKQWIKIHTFDLSKTYTFPNNGNESYRFHSKVKQDELAIRKGAKQKLSTEDKILRPL
ncbi:TIGR03986 family type III CRISPR-associated RAMP protein [Pseudoalteromonas piscicida]|uniref:TIGR03986 family type III CRISPR-associated RAMP protein n=1 Tax=Pseudoalteromonas piscicida TaxID=43662 RepID=UPI001C98DEA6|nr:TIGR03986 family CRISPR-associated RAMP protein [Pseudoalteromonas piscicida]QZO14475.1 TIGR03986 family CRISPR-associated RAMP protein [Pseudoalteromonas piscicida]